MRLQLAAVLILTIGGFPSADAQSFTQWRFTDSTDAFTDEMQLSLHSEATNSVRGEMFLLLCTDDMAAVSADDGGFNVDQSESVQVRIDDNPAWSFTGRHVRGGAYVSYDHGVVQRMARDLRDGQSTLTYRAGSNTVRVPLSGSTMAATAFLERCPHIN